MDREKVVERMHEAIDMGVCVDLFMDILELLKERESVKPKSKSRHGEYPQIVHRCGNCNEILYRHYKFCPTCGRQVKWE